MALDVYVMPLWRFKAGDFSSPLEVVFGDKVKAVIVAESSHSASWWMSKLRALNIFRKKEQSSEQRRAIAASQVEKLKKEVSRLSGFDLEWRDQGEIHYNQQFHGSRMIKALAVWHDHRDTFPEFEKGPEGDFYKHPLWSVPKLSVMRFPTLTDYNFNGYLFPVPFPGVYRVEPYTIANRWNFHHCVASTERMRDELAELVAFIDEQQARRGPNKSKLIEETRIWVVELQKICRLSEEYQLPVIFHG